MPQPGYSAEQWILIRTTYEAEDMHNESMTDIVDRLRKEHPEYKKWPAKGVIDRHRKVEYWVKGKLSQKVIQSIQEKAIERCAKYKLTLDVAAETLSNGVRSQAVGIERFEKGVQEAVQTMTDGVPSSETVLALKSVVERFLSDMGTPLKYLQEYHKIVGLYAPVKVEKTVTDGTRDNSLKSLSDEELTNRIERGIKMYLVRKRIKKGQYVNG